MPFVSVDGGLGWSGVGRTGFDPTDPSVFTPLPCEPIRALASPQSSFPGHDIHVRATGWWGAGQASSRLVARTPRACGARASRAWPAPHVSCDPAARAMGGASPVSSRVRQIFPQIKRTNKLYYKNKQNLFSLLTNKN